MSIRCRLRRFIFFYKSLACCTIIFLFFMVCFGLFTFIFNTLETSVNPNCPYEDPIDVVYTWVNGSDPVFIENLNEQLKGKNSSADSSKQRYDDKYELKFSLRSLEKYAPWINHVYIVTNGQIPYWLNLDYEKISIVTHEDIFKNTFNLPTFSSPAIESNIHRISGLSRRFIYFNDDVFLGAPIYVDDFYAPNKGFLIYLAWPVPNCAPNCPWMYVSDGQCDKDCHLPQCQMDGGDCEYEETPTTIKINLDDIENIKEENKTRDQYLAETIDRVRSNFYNSFMKKVIPKPKNISWHQSSLTEEKFSIKPFDIHNVTNYTDYVNEHNKNILEIDKLKRRITRKRRNAHNSNDNVFSKLFHRNRYIDAYSASLQHTNRMLNKKYGFKSRKVPAHAPILIDKEIMENLQFTFAKDFAVTEKNKIRSENDVQFSFSYYYFLISETNKKTIGDIFDEFDTDFSSTWSDREIRTILSQLYELPLSYAIVDHFEDMLLNCSEIINLSEVPTPPYERYIDSRLPTISKRLVNECSSLTDFLLKRFGTASKYKYEIIGNSENKYVTFKMLNSNISDVVGNLDDIRNNRKKFICLNDNLDESKESENELVRAILYDFYLSLFPLPSKYELPEDYRNKFPYMKDLIEWKSYRYNIKMFLYCLIVILLYLTIYNLCRKRCCQILNKLFC